MSNKQIAQEEAIKRAVSQLAEYSDIESRLSRLGLSAPENGIVKLRAFGSDMLLDVRDFSIMLDGKNAPAKPGDQILILHYLLCEFPIEPTGELITFRHFTGGQFYWQPFLSRSIDPLVSKIGNNLELLKKNLAKFDWTSTGVGDFGARIHTLGKIYIELVYRVGDDEFPSTADVLFDSSLKRVFVAEDAAVLASRICIGLLF